MNVNYPEIGEEIGTLVESKQAAYGDSFNKAANILEILYPNGVSVSNYKDLLAICRVVDKLFRVANNKDYCGESPWKDIAGYGMLGLVNHESQRLDD